MTCLKAIAAALASGIIANSALSAPVGVNLSPSVESGAGLTLSHWPEDGWSVQQYDQLVEIRFPNTELNLDVDPAILDRMEGVVNDVDSEIKDGDSFLRLTLGCACPVVLSGGPSVGINISVLDQDRVSPGPDAGLAPIIAPIPVAKADRPGSGPTRPSAGGIDPEEVREQLLSQLMRAAAAGVIEMSEDSELVEVELPDPVVQGPSEPTFDLPPESEEPTNSIPEGEVGSVPVTIAEGAQVVDPVTTIDAETPQEAVPVVPVAAVVSEPQCFPAEAFVFPETTGSGVFSELLADRRRRLLGEFDQQSESAAIELAQLYISVKAPQEALAVLNDTGLDHPLRELYIEIANVLGENDSIAGASLTRQDCEGDQALWRAFMRSKDGATGAALKDEAMAGRALSRLPLVLRQEVAAELGFAAVAESDWSAARRFQAMAERAGDGLLKRSGKTLMLAARLAGWHDDPQRVIELLMLARDTASGAEADAATIALADFVLSSPEHLEADTSGLRRDLATISARARGTPVGNEAFKRQAKLLARAELEIDTVDFVNDGVRAGLYPATLQAELLSELVAGSAGAGLSRPLGLLYLENPGRFAKALEQDPFRRSVVRSLAEIGLPVLAEGLVRAGDLDRSEIATPLAEAFLRTADPRAALEVANGISDDQERGRLRDAALRMMGDSAPTPPIANNAIGDGGIDEARLALDAALASDDLEQAVDASLALLDHEPTQERAEQAVFLAVRAGHSEIPKRAKEILSEASPEQLAKLQTLFVPRPTGPDSEDPASVVSFIEVLDTEMELIEGYLEDG